MSFSSVRAPGTARRGSGLGTVPRVTADPAASRTPRSSPRRPPTRPVSASTTSTPAGPGPWLPCAPTWSGISASLADDAGWLPAPGDVCAPSASRSTGCGCCSSPGPLPDGRHPVGLSFAVEPHVRPLPRSLVNIGRELRDDVGVRPPEHGDLSSWTDSGVLLLNRVLTVRAGSSGSHRRLGWQAVTDAAVRALARGAVRSSRCCGARTRQQVQPLLDGVPVVAGVHPSPLSASRGFFGSAPSAASTRCCARPAGTGSTGAWPDRASGVPDRWHLTVDEGKRGANDPDPARPAWAGGRGVRARSAHDLPHGAAQPLRPDPAGEPVERWELRLPSGCVGGPS